MAYEQRDNSGSLFRNDRREKDTHPNAKGKAMIDGQWYWVSAWTKEPRGGGEKFQSLSFERMTDEQVEKYAGGGQQQDRNDARSPRASDGGRGRSQMPFGKDRVSPADDVPFAWEGRQGQSL